MLKLPIIVDRKLPASSWCFVLDRSITRNGNNLIRHKRELTVESLTQALNESEEWPSAIVVAPSLAHLARYIVPVVIANIFNPK